MIIKGITDEDFLNYKKPALFIAFPYCDFKCDKENGNQICQNSSLAYASNKSIEVDELVKRYLENDISQAIVCGGLEPLESFGELLTLLETLRKYSQDDFVIYTGFNESEIEIQLTLLKQYPNVIVKFGRFIPGYKPHFDPVLGIELASDNQFAKVIS